MFSTNQSNFDALLKKLTNDDRLAIATPKRHAMSNQAVSRHNIYCFGENEQILAYPLSMFIRRDHPLQARINYLIQLAIEGGLIGKWTKDIERKFREESNQLMGPHILTVEHIFLGLVFLGLYTLFAIGAFIAEHIVHTRVNRPNAHRFWGVADMLIDGERHFLLPEWKLIKNNHSKCTEMNNMDKQLKRNSCRGKMLYKRCAIRRTLRKGNIGAV